MHVPKDRARSKEIKWIHVGKKILFTGGGSSGHVTPNLALIPKFQREDWQVIYVGSTNGIEKQIISRLNIPYFSIPTGKLRRYFSWQTFIDPFKILAGLCKACFICFKEKPNVIFSKGGFVSVPIVIASWLNRIPVIIHEADLTPGLANKLSTPFATKICVTFSISEKYYAKNKVVFTGLPIRAQLLQGNAEMGRAFCGFKPEKPIILVAGGGLGAIAINLVLREKLPKLLQQYQIVHLCGKGKTDAKYNDVSGYKQFEYLNEEYSNILACADLIVSRAGANSLYEMLSLKKLHILIPLPLSASRGDQIHNANYFAKQGMSEVIIQENLTADLLQEKIHHILLHKDDYYQSLNQLKLPDSVELIYHLINQVVNNKIS